MMKKIACLACMLLLLTTLVAVPSAVAMGVDFSGNWACMYVDTGDGVLHTDYEGANLQEMLVLELQSDGTVLLTSFGMQQQGTWMPTGAGIAMIVDDTAVPFTYTDDMLVNTEDGITMYFGRAADEPKQGGFSTLVNIGKADDQPAFSFAGTWQCVAYEASGVSYDISMFFPDGIMMTLSEDGSGSAQLTPEYAEKFSWSETDDGISVNGGFLLYDPVWDPETDTLSLCYAADIIRLIFEKTEASAITDDGAVLPQVYTCDFFSAAFPEDWVQDEYGTYSWDNYDAMQYDLKDSSGWNTSYVTISAGVEEVADYRDKVDTLLTSAIEAGKDALDEIVIGGVTFLGLTYGDYSIYTDYTARVPEASITLDITISSPDKIQDVLPAILDSIRFTYAIPDPPHVDPPLAEDGVPYQPVPTTVNVGGYDLKAEWLSADASVIPKDKYNGGIAVTGDTVYVVSGKKLYAMDRNGATLAPAEPITLSTEYLCLSTAWDGTLYITKGYGPAIAFKDGTLEKIDIDGYIAINPEGQWGLSYWSYDNVNRIAFTEAGLASKAWALTDLSDDDARQGRFSTVSYIMITPEHVYVAGYDVQFNNAVRIAKYDFDGNELATFGGSDWLDDSAFGSVTGIVETANGILVQDGFYQNYKLFAPDGTFLGYVRCDDLLGTDYPWPLSMTASENGALALLSQDREDGSASELLVFEITGF